MAGIHIGPNKVTSIYVGTTPVREVYVGTVKVWPDFARQRMNKTGSWGPAGYTAAIVTGWAPDSTYPATISADTLVVTGGGSANISAHLTTTAQWPIGSITVELRVNGVAVDSASGAGTHTLTWSGVLNEGDTAALWASGAWTNSITAAHVDVIPQ